MMYVRTSCLPRTFANMSCNCSTSSGGVICRGHSPISRTGLAPGRPTKDVTSSEYISGELVVRESQQSSTTVQFTPASGSPRRKGSLLLGSGKRLTGRSTIEYVAQQLVQGYKSGDNVTQAFLDNYDFYIFPFVNPDGMYFPSSV
jgi:hypothetical protein